MDGKAFHKLSYGLYILSTSYNGKYAGCIINTAMQVTSKPAQISVTVNKENATEKMLAESCFFAVTALTQEADMELIGKFGFQTSSETDKFAGFHTAMDGNGVQYVTDCAAARISCRVVKTVDLGSHVMFIGEVTEAEGMNGAEPMTYSYYHQVKKGVTPKNSPAYQEETEKKGWRCSVCGYILESETIPEDYVCPICGQGRDKLVKLA